MTQQDLSTIDGNRNTEEMNAQPAAIIESAEDAIISKDLNGIITSWNKGAEKIFGYTAAEAIGKPVTILIPPNRIDEEPYILERIRRSELIDHYETVRRRKDGSEIDISLTISPIVDKAGKVTGASKIARDITERKRAEAAMAQLAAIIESSEDAIISKDLNGIITSWNKGAEKIFGYTAAEAIGKPVTILIPPNRIDEEPYILERIRRSELIDHYETVRRRKDGSEIDISLTISPIVDKAGKVTGASKIARDITERKRAEIDREELLRKESAARSEAEAANRSKDEFLAIISHELRSPVSAISGWATLIREGGLDPDDVDKALAVIERNTKALNRLIDDLLDSARINSGKLRLELSPLNINSVLADALDVVRSAAEAKGVEIRAHYGAKPVVVAGDATRLRQIVWNLLTNAIKFTPSGGRVELHVERAKEHIRVIVSDTGEGIKPEFLPHVFDRFRQADSSNSRRQGGLGLGLALVKNLAELHGGKVEVESSGAGRGATFIVTLPMATRNKLTGAKSPAVAAGANDETQTEDASSLPADFTIAGLRVLLVDDHEEARISLANLLCHHGAIVTAASSGSEALAILSGSPGGVRPDILICDIMMPVEDGYAVLRKIREFEAEIGVAASQQIPAIALTALSGNEDRLRALRSGFQSHIPKPAKPIELMLVIASLAKPGR